MKPLPESFDERLIRMVIKDRSVQARMIADVLRGSGATSANNADQRKIFWQRSPEVDEQALWAQGLDPREIVQKVYPGRVELAKAMSGSSLTEIADYFDNLAAKGPPDWEAPDGAISY
ncbi:MAG: hypothetical protein ACRDGM_18150 [bacterium]